MLYVLSFMYVDRSLRDLVAMCAYPCLDVKTKRNGLDRVFKLFQVHRSRTFGDAMFVRVRSSVLR